MMTIKLNKLDFDTFKNFFQDIYGDEQSFEVDLLFYGYNAVECDDLLKECINHNRLSFDDSMTLLMRAKLEEHGVNDSYLKKCYKEINSFYQSSEMTANIIEELRDYDSSNELLKNEVIFEVVLKIVQKVA